MSSSSFQAGFDRIAAFLPLGALLLALPLAACGTDDDAETGTLVLTVSGLPVEGAADITVTGPGDFQETFTDSETIAGLQPGAYEILAEEVVTGSGDSDDFYEPAASRKTVEVRAGERAVVEVAYLLASDPPISTTGQLRVEVTGLPAGAAASITVTGPEGFEVVLTGSEVLRDLEPGSYAIVAAEVEANGEFYVPTVDPSPAEVEVEAVTQVNVAYALEILEPA